MTIQKFHDRHGDGITLSGEGTVAQECAWRNREVFSCQPLQPGESFTVKVGKAGSVSLHATLFMLAL